MPTMNNGGAFESNRRHSDAPHRWNRLIALERCLPGKGTFVEHGGRELAVFVMGDGSVHVVDNSCPHAGGNLSAGEVESGVVTCPWHQWQFRLDSGVCVDSPAARVPRYPARIHDGWVEVELTQAGRP